MSWDLSKLKSLSPDSVEFDDERARIIRDHIMSLPPEKRNQAYAQQCRIDLARETMPREQFEAFLWKDMAENLANLADAMGALTSLIAGSPAVKAISER